MHSMRTMQSSSALWTKKETYLKVLKRRIILAEFDIQYYSVHEKRNTETLFTN